jgi:hypothetical protein
VTEEEWLACSDPTPMLAWLESSGRLNERKQYRLAVAHWDSAQETLSAIHTARLLEQCEEAAMSRWAADLGIAFAPDITASIKGWGRGRDVRLVRCVVGSPFRAASVEPSWRTPTVVGLAQNAYKEWTRPYNYLDAAGLAVLADALEEAGCTDAELLGHLRGPGPHVRGCWVLDLLLGKE